MPYTLKTQQIAVKDPDTGVYSGVDILTEQTTEGLLTEIIATGTEVKTDVAAQMATERSDFNTYVSGKEAELDQYKSTTETNINTYVTNKNQEIATMIADADEDVSDLEDRKQDVATAVSGMLSKGVDNSLTTANVPAESKAVGDLFETIVEGKSTQPNDKWNRLWIKPSVSDYEIPTMDEFDDLKSALTVETTTDGFSVNGGIRVADGVTVSGTNRLTFDSKFSGKEFFSARAINGYLFFVFAWDGSTYLGSYRSGTWAAAYGSEALTSFSFAKYPSTYKFKVAIKRSDNGDISLTEASNFIVTVNALGPDSTLMLSRQAADAKKVGDALSSKADNRLNVYSISEKYGSFTDKEQNGVVFTWNQEEIACTVDSDGAASTGNAFNDIITKTSSQSAGITGGQTYYFSIKSSDPDNLYAELWYYINGTLEPSAAYKLHSSKAIILPNNVSGILFRICAKNGVIFDNATIMAEILNRDPYADEIISNTYNNTNYNTYSPTNISQYVTLNATPTITADTNNYLASTGDTSDRTADILAMLTASKVCRLGPGNFYIKGLIMPSGSLLVGSGNATKVYMITDSTAGADNSGFAIKMGSYCTVKDFSLYGASSAIDVSTPEYSPDSTYNVGDHVIHDWNFFECSTPISTPEAWTVGHWTQVTAATLEGNRHGILWQGTYSEDKKGPYRGIISNVRIQRFSGGGIRLYDTGLGITTCLEVSDVYIWNCWAGIDVAYWSEFNKFTDVQAAECFIGCVNNGGNNVFVNCDFSTNLEIAMLFDNSVSQSPNNAHGSAIGCVFNHTGHNGVANAGTGIRMINCHAGFTFTGCQIFFSKVILEDSDGVVFSGCIFGKNNCQIRVNNGGAVLFIGNMHSGEPSETSEQNPWIEIINNTNTHFVNCYVKSTGEEVKP